MTRRASQWLVVASFAFSTCAFAQNFLWTWTVEGYAGEFPTRAAAEAYMRSLSPAHAQLVAVRNSEQIGAISTGYSYAQPPGAEDGTTATIYGGVLAPCAPDAPQLIEVVGVTACEAASGNNEESETDIVAPGIEFTRAYNSHTGTANTMGVGWTHSYEAHLALSPEGYLEGLVRPDGRQEFMHSDGSEIFVSTAATGLVAKLVNGEWRVYHDSGKFEVYDTTGRLTRIDNHGQVTLLNYSDGLLTSVTGPGGHAIQLLYTGELLTRVIDPAGIPIEYDYDPANNLIRVANLDASTREYFYERIGLPHHLTGINHEDGIRFASFDYDETGRLVFAERADATHRFRLTYAPDSTNITDQNGVNQTLSFTVDGLPRRTLTQTRGEFRRTASYYDFYYEDAQRRMRESHRRQFDTVHTYFMHDPFHVTTVSEYSGMFDQRETVREYLNAETDLPTAIHEQRRNTTFTYDASGNVLTRTVSDFSPAGPRTWSYTYDPQGRRLSEDGPRTDVVDLTTYDYYPCAHGAECGQLRIVTNALGQTTFYNEYNPYGRPTLITDINGVATRILYDARQRIVARTVGVGLPIPETTLYEYWQTGQLRKVTTPDGATLKYEYDGALRLTGIADGVGNRVSYTVDHMGNRVADNTYDPGLLVTRMHTRSFNQLNQLEKDIDAAGTSDVTTSYLRDEEGSVLGIFAPLNRFRAFRADAWGRKTLSVDPSGSATTYVYRDLEGTLTVTAPRNLVTSYQFNGFDEVAGWQAPDSGFTVNTYDSAGNLRELRDARNVHANYTYDALNRLRTATYSSADPMITYTYDGGFAQKGRLTMAGDSTNLTTWTYDPQGRVTNKLQTVGPFNKSVGYVYDSVGRLMTLTLPSGTSIAYLPSLDSHNQVWGIRVQNSPLGTIVSDITYAPFGAVTGWRWGNGTRASREYDLDGNIDAMDDVWQVGLRHDAGGRLTNVDGGQSWTMEYDANDRLTRYFNSDTGGTFSTYRYDASGNRTRAESSGGVQNLTISFNSNRVLSVANTGSPMRMYAYDPSGNVFSTGQATFGYNGRGLVKSGAASGGATWLYLYNAQGQRIKKYTTPSTGTVFMYDEAGHLIGEYTAAGVLIQETVWLGDIPVATIRPKTGGGIELFYVHTDHLDAPRRVTKPSNNAVVWWSTSTAFGMATTGGTTGFTYNLRTGGQYFDVETNTHSIDGRTYDPMTGRYLQPNPLTPDDGSSPYAYARGNPLAVIDPRCVARCLR